METVENMKVEEPEGEVGSTNEEFKEIDVKERSETQTGTSDVKTDSNDITNTPDIDSENEGILVLKCEPCLYRKLDAVATKYCKDCDERYCDPCTLCHTTQKQTKGHFILDIKECLDMKTKCEPCACKQRNTDAIFICKDCDEHLCKECKEFHVSQKRNNKHVIRPLDTQLFCATCRSGGHDSLATSYCTDCEDPEPFCVTCADQHTAMKISRNHLMSSELESFIQLKEQTQTGDSYSRDGSSCGILSASDIVADANSNATDHLLCEPCFYQNLDKPATHYCFTCDERYCEKCTKRHKTHRRTEDHNVIDLSLLNPKKMCDACKYSGEDLEAGYKCVDCAEHLCEDCMKYHRSQKQTRSHKIHPIFSQPLCESCYNMGDQVVATSFCLDCDEPELICQPCVKHHLSMKQSRTHNISDDLFAYTVRTFKNNSLEELNEEKVKSIINMKSDTKSEKRQNN